MVVQSRESPVRKKAIDKLIAMMTSDKQYRRKEVLWQMLKLLRPEKLCSIWLSGILCGG